LARRLSFLIALVLVCSIAGLAWLGFAIRNLGHQAFGDYGAYIASCYGDMSASQSWYKGSENIEHLFLGSGICFGVAVTMFAWCMSISLAKEAKQHG